MKLFHISSSSARPAISRDLCKYQRGRGREQKFITIINTIPSPSLATTAFSSSAMTQPPGATPEYQRLPNTRNSTSKKSFPLASLVLCYC
ncbi:hypothetical protein E2C01_008684 [Portunus trituberculatus]|uniref:Uncharacterized protein n=1 Tax=Portunus trituberculatus TaxID=210409 RepID=A0A5B7D2H2_PORTR|nr:hypothetical protein [Portunus trituberculatus]